MMLATLPADRTNDREGRRSGGRGGTARPGARARRWAFAAGVALAAAPTTGNAQPATAGDWQRSSFPAGTPSARCNPATVPPLPIAVAREDRDGDLRPDRLGTCVTVAGRAEVASGILLVRPLQVGLADGTGAIALFDWTQGQPIAEGDSVVATGRIAQYKGLTEVMELSYRVIPGPRRVPAAIDGPLPRTTVALEALEARLVRVEGRVIRSHRSEGGDVLVLRQSRGNSAAAEAGDAPVVRVFAANGAANDFALERFRPGDRVRVTGLLWQRDTTGTGAGGYYVLPRVPSDLSTRGLSGAQRAVLARSGLLGLFLLAGWIIALRLQVRRRTRELSESEGRFRALLESAPDAVLAVVRDRVAYANPAAARLLGEDLGRALPAPIREAIARLDSAHADEWPLRAELVPPAGLPAAEGAPSRRTAEVRQVEIVAAPIRYHDAEATQLLVRDVSVARRLDEERTRAERLACIGGLAGGLAHDFNNLLAAIQLNCELLAGEVTEAGRADVAEIQAATERAAILTRQLLALSPHQARDTQVIDLLDLTRTLCETTGADVDFDAPADAAHLHLAADGTLIRDAIEQLVDNARAAVTAGQSIRVTLRPVADPFNGAGAELAVEDHGVGMDDETRKHAFEPFFTTRRSGNHRGLGLAVVASAARQSGATVSLDSAPGRGTTVRFSWTGADVAWSWRGQSPHAPHGPPVSGGDALLTAAPGTGRDGHPPALPPSSGSGKHHLLLVEDEESVRNAVARLLASLGWRVSTAVDGREALEALDALEAHPEEPPPTVVLSDLLMPVMGGRALAQELAVRRPGLPVVLMSGFTDGADGVDGLSNVVGPVLGKPFARAALSAALDRALARRKGG